MAKARGHCQAAFVFEARWHGTHRLDSSNTVEETKAANKRHKLCQSNVGLVNHNYHGVPTSLHVTICLLFPLSLGFEVGPLLQ